MVKANCQREMSVGSSIAFPPWPHSSRAGRTPGAARCPTNLNPTLGAALLSRSPRVLDQSSSVKAASAGRCCSGVPCGDEERTTNSARRSACVIFTSIYFAFSPGLSKQFTGLLIALNLRIKPLARVLLPGQPLLDLHGPEDDGAQCDGDGVISYGQRFGVQKALEKGGVDRQELQHEGEGDRPEQRLVREQADLEERLVAGANGHDVAHLGESKGGEDHGLPDLGRGLRVQ